MKRLLLGILVAGMQLSVAFSAYAGQWEQDEYGWRYETDDGIMLRRDGDKSMENGIILSRMDTWQVIL